jgi:hypothetical protein
LTVTAGTGGWAGLMCSVVLGFVVFVGGRSDDPLTRTGRRVQYASITGGIWGREFAGGCRYL